LMDRARIQIGGVIPEEEEEEISVVSSPPSQSASSVALSSGEIRTTKTTKTKAAKRQAGALNQQQQQHAFERSQSPASISNYSPGEVLGERRMPTRQRAVVVPTTTSTTLSPGEVSRGELLSESAARDNVYARSKERRRSRSKGHHKQHRSRKGQSALSEAGELCCPVLSAGELAPLPAGSPARRAQVAPIPANASTQHLQEDEGVFVAVPAADAASSAAAAAQEYERPSPPTPSPTLMPFSSPTLLPQTEPSQTGMRTQQPAMHQQVVGGLSMTMDTPGLDDKEPGELSESQDAAASGDLSEGEVSGLVG